MLVSMQRGKSSALGAAWLVGLNRLCTEPLLRLFLCLKEHGEFAVWPKSSPKISGFHRNGLPCALVEHACFHVGWGWSEGVLQHGISIGSKPTQQHNI